MKIKSFALVVVIIAVIAAIWLFTQPQTPETDKTPAALVSAKTYAVKPTASTGVAPAIPATPAIAQVEKPVAPPAKASASSPATSATAAQATDPRENLDTAIAEAARLLEAKDFATLFKEFAPPEVANNLPPGMTIEQMAQMMQAEPRANAEMQHELDSLHAIQGLTPTLSDNDNTATYQANLPDGSTKAVILKKADTGLWYIKDM